MNKLDPNALEWFEEVCAKFNDDGCDYLVAGGIATILHGNPRLTMDLDCYIRWDRDNALKIMRDLESLGFRLTQPIPLESLADGSTRQRLIREKGMLVATFIHVNHPARVVDLMFEQPCVSFEDARRSAVEIGTVECPLPTMSVEHLIRMKKFAGREKDLQDVSVLERDLER